MLRQAARIVMIGLMVLNGLLFIANIYVLGDTEAAIAMHDDLAPTANDPIVIGKVLDCFIVGGCYLIAAWGVARRKFRLAIFGVWGFALFDGFYMLELLLWGKSHPRVWFDFCIFGGLSLLIGIYCWQVWRNRDTLAGSA